MAETEMDVGTSEADVSVKEISKKPTIRKKNKAAEGPVPCQYCGKEFQNRGKTLRHERHNCAVKPVKDAVQNAIALYQFQCKVCDQSFKYASGLSKHEQKHELPGGFFCKTCDAQFVSDLDRVSHRETAHKMFKCQICSELFDSETGYVDHIELLHNGKEREYVVCTVCGAQFRTLAQLSSHKSTKCGTVKRFHCKLCGSKFMTQNTLNVHATIHIGEKTHLCNYCGNSFLSKGQLKVHERSHTGEKPFKCEVCKKAFAYRESLVTHSSLHTGIKPYLCEGCGSRFSCIGNVIKHRRSRPDTCGSPRFKTNVKVAPRASAKNFGRLTKSRSKRNTRSTNPPPPDAEPDIVVAHIDTEYDGNLCPDELGDHIDVDEADENADDQNFDGILDDTNDIKLDAIISDLEAVPDGAQQHTFMSTTESMEIVSNVEIEYITSDNMHTTSLLIESMESEPVEPPEEFGNPQYIINFVAELDKQQDGYDEQWQDDEEFEVNDPTNSFEEFKQETPADVAVPESILPNELVYSEGSSAKIFQETIEDIVPDEQFKEKEEFIEEVQPSLSPQSENFDLSDHDIKQSIAAIEELPQTMESVIPPAIKILMYGCSICNQEFRYHTKYLVHLQKKHDIRVSQVIVEETGSAKPVMKSVQQTGGAGIKRATTGRKSTKEVVAEATKPAAKEIVFCGTCDRSFASIGALRKHNTVHGPDGSLVHKCGCCRLFFGTEELRQQHEVFMHKDKLYCKECDKMFKCPDSLVVHNQQAHIVLPLTTSTASTPTTAVTTSPQQRKYQYVCPRCGRKFSSKLALTDHERSKCGDSPVYKCNVCDKSYHSAGSLKTHSTVHTGELPHLCNFCGKAFRTQGQVKVHERKHNGEKPFQCEFCPKSFAYRESLLTHVSQHTGLKRFMCPACGSRFSCITNLQAHRKSHINTCGQVPLVTKPVGPMVLGASDSETLADHIVTNDSIEITKSEI